jgi:alpha-L-fucosidase
MKKVLLTLLLLISVVSLRAQEQKNEVFKDREYPQWFSDAKLGIFIHYGLYSIPSYSDKEQYAEWFYKGLISQDSLRIKFQKEVFGENFEYRDYKDLFKAELFDAAEWAELFKKSGAKYILFTSKHHDGYCMWDSKYAKGWSSATTTPKRDFCAELAEEVRKRDIKFGLYYSLTEWTNPLYRWTVDTNISIDNYVDKHLIPQFKELVDNFKPSVIFSDGDWDFNHKSFRSNEMVQYYYDVVGEEGVVNDRWGIGFNHGYATPEYSSGIMDKDRPWAECRGMSRSFALNRNADLETYLTSEDLIKHFARLVAAGGGLTINVGPSADGKIPLLQQERLLDLGKWIEINEEAIYGSRAFETVYQNQTLTIGREDSEINYNWVRNAPMKGVTEDNFSIFWHTNLTPEKTDTYTIYLEADEEAKLEIKNSKSETIFSLESQKAEAKGQVKLKKGENYKFELTYKEKTHEAVAQLSWESSSIERQSIKSQWKGEVSWEETYVCFTKNNGNLYAISLKPIDNFISFDLAKAPKEDMKIYLLGETTIEIPWSYDFENKRITLDTRSITPANITTKGAWVFKLDDYINYIE